MAALLPLPLAVTPGMAYASRCRADVRHVATAQAPLASPTSRAHPHRAGATVLGPWSRHLAAFGARAGGASSRRGRRAALTRVPRQRAVLSAAPAEASAAAADLASVLQVSPRDLLMTAVCVFGAYGWVRLFDELARRELLEQKLSRKIVHITTGILFCSLWPFFSPAPSARFLAALAPAANVARVAALGAGLLIDDAAVRSMSRGSDPKELLGGPLYYGLVMSAVTVLFWRTSPVGCIALSFMCAGDGFADIVGRRFGAHKLPWNPRKSWAGSAAMFAFGFPVALGAAQLFSALGFYECDTWSTAARVALISLGATLVESLPLPGVLDDNVTVPASCILLGLALFPRP